MARSDRPARQARAAWSSTRSTPSRLDADREGIIVEAMRWHPQPDLQKWSTRTRRRSSPSTPDQVHAVLVAVPDECSNHTGGDLRMVSRRASAAASARSLPGARRVTMVNELDFDNNDHLYGL